MSDFSFGSGSMWATRTDVANSTPIPFGILQEGSIDITYANKPLYGQYQFPVAVGRGTAKVTGKAKFARIFGRQLNDILFGQSTVVGLLSIAQNEVGTIPTTPFQVTVANSATFDTDLGVFYSATGLPLQKVASAPAAGQYSVSGAGVYTFNTADSTKVVLISYSYTGTGAAPNQKVTVANPLLGVQPSFQLMFNTTYNGSVNVIKMLACVSNKFSLQTKLEDFTIPEIDFDCFCDASNNLMTYSTSE
jgi:hypothetical protein